VVHSTLRVFLVEDSASIRERLVELLTAPGRIEVVGHADSEEAARTALRELRWDAVIVDLQLRQGNGFRLLKALRESRAPDAKVVVFTNHAFPVFRAKSLQLGADHFFDKAREYDDLREVLAALADERAQSAAEPRPNLDATKGA